MQQGAGGMPMMQQGNGSSGQPQSGHMGGMPMMQGMGDRMQKMQAHMKTMEQRLENIQKLLEQLVALQKGAN